MTSTELFSTLALLTPYDIDLPKRRAGRVRDGAYVLVDLPPDRDILSFGVGCDISYEVEMAERGHRVFLFDHTVRRLPAQHPRFHLTRAGICGPGEETRRLRTLESHVAAIADLSDRLVLKIDVEGAEWATLATIDPALLDRFDQVLIEFHELGRLAEPDFRTRAHAGLAALASRFTLFHVHGNNIGGMRLADGMPVADVLEASYVRSDLVHRQPSRTVYPTPLNKGNSGRIADMPLFFFPFLPANADAGEMAAVITRIEADVER